jgi:hypothetical protein
VSPVIRGLLLPPILALLFASHAAAQSLYVSGGVYGNILRFGRTVKDSPTILDEDLGGVAGGVSAAIGGTIASHVAIQFEAASPAVVKQNFVVPRPVQGAPFVSEPHRRATYRSSYVSILGGYTTPINRHVTATVLGGALFLQEGRRLISELSFTVPPRTESDNAITVTHIVPAIGFDLVLRMTSHLALVPQGRMYRSAAPTPVPFTVNLGALTIAPGVSARWLF